MTTLRALLSAHRSRRALLWLTAVAGCALLTTGCGSSPTVQGVAHLGATTPTSSSAGSQDGPAATTPGGNGTAMLQYAECMRRTGVPDFPDPTKTGIHINAGPGSDLNPNSPQFEHAQSVCQRLLPNGGKLNPAARAALVAQALKFSQCMRAHGVTDFPDPQVQSNGGIGIRISATPGSDLNPNSPTFEAAQSACQNIMPGRKGGPGPSTHIAG